MDPLFSLPQVSLSTQSDNWCNPQKNSPLEKIIENILKTYSPKVIAFGEIHFDCEIKANKKATVKSTLEYFAEKVLPKLKKYGYKDLVLEFLLDDRRVEDELNYYRETGSLNKEKTPILLKMTEICKLRGFKKLLSTARKLGIKLHSGGPTIKELKDPEIQKEIHDTTKWGPKSSQLTTENLREKITELIQQGKKVVSYSGLWHNDIDPFVPESSFGDEFRQQLGDGYIEVDLMVRKQLIQLINSPEGCPPYPPLHDYKTISSAKRNVCDSPENGHFVIILK